MRKVISIEGRIKRTGKNGKKYTITYLTVDDGTEVEYYGYDVKVGDKLEVFFDNRWQKVKARKTPKA